MPAISGSRTRSIIGRAWQPSTTRSAAAVMPRCGHSHGRALRTVADRLLSVACTLLEQQTLFDPSYEVRDAAGA
jgi:hypothetical protein